MNDVTKEPENPAEAVKEELGSFEEPEIVPVTQPLEPPVPEEGPATDPATAATPVTKSEHHKNGAGLIMLVIVGLLVVITLVGLAYMAIKTDQKSDRESKDQNTSQVAPVKAEVVADDVTTETESIDTALSTLNDEKDFSEAELSDQNLGLE